MMRCNAAIGFSPILASSSLIGAETAAPASATAQDNPHHGCCPPSSASAVRATGRAASCPTIAATSASILGGPGSLTAEQRRFSNKYLVHNFKETRPAPYWAERQTGMGSHTTEHIVKNSSSWRAPRHREFAKHPNLWMDTDSTTNPHYRSYWQLHRPLNRLLGRASSWDATGNGPLAQRGPNPYAQSFGPFELENDLRFKGVERSSAINLYYERHRGPQRPQYHLRAHQRHHTVRPAAALAADLAPSIAAAAAAAASGPNSGKGAAVRQQRAEEAERQSGSAGLHERIEYDADGALFAANGIHAGVDADAAVRRSEAVAAALAPLPSVAALKLTEDAAIKEVTSWWAELARLIDTHRAAVGDYQPGYARNPLAVHRFFVHFTEAITSFQYQDGHLATRLMETRPSTLGDIFGIFIEMEANRVNPAYCPRCNLPFHGTSFCGEGDMFSPFRQWRGRPAPHKPWGKEWYDVAAERAEALWYRATEDEIFGVERHTQKQAEELLRVYCLAKQRGRANAFMVNLQGSPEFLDGTITITPAMQQMYDALLDSTAHPTLLTNGDAAITGDAGRYLPGTTPHTAGAPGSVPHSPLQQRVDMEVAKFRRTQKEEGVVPIPPQGWKIDTTSIVPYEVDAKTGKIINWRAVKEGIEKSYLETGLPATAWTAHERREIAHLQQWIAGRDARLSALRQQLEEDKLAAAKRSAPHTVYPDESYYRVFHTGADALGAFQLRGLGRTAQTGMKFTCVARAFPDPAAVEIDAFGERLRLDVRDETCDMYGFRAGMKLQIRQTGQQGQQPQTVHVVGVDVTDAADKWALYVVDVKTRKAFALGNDAAAIRAKYEVTVASPISYIAVLDDARRYREDITGTFIGVRDSVLYASIDGGVARPMGTADMFQSGRYQFSSADAPSTAAAAVDEPFSWAVPFRNDPAERRLQELLKAPWDREGHAPLTPNAFTAKKKHFGYTQHIEQDDFMTQEYKDRLLSRQYFANPQQFRIFPDRADESVRFGGKNDFIRVQGLPSVDRSELERGWGEAEAVPESEVQAVEQALRDIGGTRPGNFVRPVEDVASTDLNEPWWTRLDSHWQHRQQAESFEHPALRSHTDPLSLPFEGRLPMRNTSLGMGERARDVLEDLSRGFDLSPTGAAAGSATYDTLGSQSSRSAAVGHGEALVRLFEARLNGLQLDVHKFAASFRGSVDPKALLIALNEWLNHGKAPSLMLRKVLKTFLAEDLESYNSSVSNEEQMIDLDDASGVVTLARAPGSNGSIWAHQRALAFRVQSEIDGAGSRSGSALTGAGAAGRAASSTGFVLQFYLDQLQLPATYDEGIIAHVQSQRTNDFHVLVRQLVGKGIAPEVQASMKARPSTRRAHGKDAVIAQQLVHSSEVRKLLQSIGMYAEQIDATMVTLHAESAAITKKQDPVDNFVTSVEILMNLKKPASLVSVGKARAGNATELQPKAIAPAPEKLDDAVERLALLDDGYAMDLQYMTQRNRTNRFVQDEFCRLVFASPIGGEPTAQLVEETFDKYVSGHWAPTAAEAADMIVAFIRNAVEGASTTSAPTGDASADAGVGSLLQRLRATTMDMGIWGNQTAALAGAVPAASAEKGKPKSGASGAASSVLLDVAVPVGGPEQAPFTFENAAHEVWRTNAHQAEWQLDRSTPAAQIMRRGLGDAQQEARRVPVFSANPDSRSFTNRLQLAAFFTPTSLHGLDVKIAALKIPALAQFVAPNTPAAAAASSSTSSGAGAAFAEAAATPVVNNNTARTAAIPQQHVALARVANRILQRCLPLLTLWHRAAVRVGELTQPGGVGDRANVNDAVLRRILDRELDAKIELDFRANAERYWRRVIDMGGDVEARGGAGGPGGARGGSAGNRGDGKTGGGSAPDRFGGENRPGRRFNFDEAATGGSGSGGGADRRRNEVAAGFQSARSRAQQQQQQQRSQSNPRQGSFQPPKKPQPK